MSAPSVFAFLDYRRFIEAWVEWRSTQRAGYGLGVFAMNARLGRATLPNILGGRRHPSPETLDGIAEAMHLDPQEHEFLSLLVDIQRASTLDEQARLLRAIFAHPRYAAGSQQDPDLVEALTSGCSGVIFELSRLPGFQADPAWIAARLRPEVAVDEVATALDALGRAGLLDADAPHRVHTPSQVDHIAARRAHLAALDAARQALVQVPWDEREFHFTTVSVPESAVPAILTEVKAAVERVRDLADKYRDEGEAVVQVQVQAWWAGKQVRGGVSGSENT